MTEQDWPVRTRLTLIRSVAEQFEARGYVRAGLAEISSGVGVSSGAPHFHLADKAAVAEAVEHAAAGALREAAVRSRDGDGCALRRLVDVTHNVARLLCDDDVVGRAGLRLNAEGVAGRVRDLRRNGGSACTDCGRGRSAGAPSSSPPRPASRHRPGRTTAGSPGFRRPTGGNCCRAAAPCVAGALDPAGSDPAGSGPAAPGVPAEAGRVGLASR